MENKRLYPSTQMVVALDPRVLKTLLWILGWQGKTIVYYEKQYSKALKMEVSDVEKCIQTLVNVKLIDVSRIDGKWVLTPNAEQFQKYFDVPISKVLESNGVPMAEKVDWNVNEEVSNSIDDMSEDEIKRQIFILTARLNEKKQVKKIVTSPKSNEVDDLPW